MKGAFLAVLVLAALATAQTSYPPPPPGRQPAAPAPLDPNQVLAQLEQASGAIHASVSRLHIDKWKTGSDEKARLQSNADSVQRNISAALPGMISAVRTNPGDLAAGFKLYRNVSALYDVFTSLTEAAGAFGPKEDFRELAQEGQQLDALRRDLGDRVEQVASAQQVELARLRAQVRQAATAAPSRKVIVDNGETDKPAKKKTTKKSSNTAQQTSAQPQQ